MEKLLKLKTDMEKINRTETTLGQSIPKLKEKIKCIEKKVKTESKKLLSMEETLSKIKNNGNSKILNINKDRVSKQREYLEKIKSSSNIELERLNKLIEIEEHLVFIKFAEVEFTYHGKMLSLLETYRKLWENLRGPLNEKKNKLIMG